MAYRRSPVEDRQAPQKTIHPAAADGDFEIEPHIRRVRAALTDADANIAASLPDPSLVRGHQISVQITAQTAAATALTLSATGIADLTLDADGDAVLLQSDGLRWWVIANEIA